MHRPVVASPQAEIRQAAEWFNGTLEFRAALSHAYGLFPVMACVFRAFAGNWFPLTRMH
jgi:hypothetical protein